MKKKKTGGIEVSRELYSIEAIYAACYQFIGRAYVRLEEGPKKAVRVHLAWKKGAPGKDLERLAGEFHNELLHHALRLKVSSANQKIREYVVTRALLSAQAAQAEGVPSTMEETPGREQAAAPGAGTSEQESISKPGPDGFPVERESVSKPGPDGYPSEGGRADGAPVSQAPAEADDELAREIQKLLAEVEKDADKEDPLGIVAPWEETVGAVKKSPKAAGKTTVKKKPGNRKAG